MNERLKELKQQAGIDFNPDQEGLDLFAELIIQECIDCAEWVGRMNTTAVEPVNTAHAIVKRIEKHFGVEE